MNSVNNARISAWLLQLIGEEPKVGRNILTQRQGLDASGNCDRDLVTVMMIDDALNGGIRKLRD